MSRCALKRGIFVLHDCENAALRDCTRCGRHACGDHLSARTQQRVCVDCVARAEEQEALSRTPETPGDEQWVAFYRHRFYLKSEYRPLLEGRPAPFYDEYDARPFDPELAGHVDVDDERDGAFFNS